MIQTKMDWLESCDGGDVTTDEIACTVLVVDGDCRVEGGGREGCAMQAGGEDTKRKVDVVGWDDETKDTRGV